ncbi:replication protein [Psychroserpens algicola]|uniref:Replication protein n=1 Tax=Psychroserpens algicola TaxID=1719034 RepID=A0ABT0H3S9_9FLAO|nr:replication protein [Psychroserpens algicola]MCK8479044.1 replication protein [Psychroserpens algicola]
MDYYSNTTQVPNVLFDHLLKTISSMSELKVLLIIIRKTIGVADPNMKGKRLERAWISQRLFAICCNLSGRAVSTAIDGLIKKELIEVTDSFGNVLLTKRERQGTPRLYFASRLRLVVNKKQTSEPICDNAVNKLHIIKLNTIKKSCYNDSQGVQRLSDSERLNQLLDITKNGNT